MTLLGELGQKKEETYTFIDGDVEKLHSELIRPKIDTGIQEQPEDDEQDDDLAEKEAKQKPTSSMSKATAKMFVDFVDMPLVSLMSLALPEKDKKAIETTAEQKDGLADALADYMKVMGGDIPPWLMLLIAALGTYGSKIPNIIMIRKANKRADLLEQQAKEKDAKIAELEAKLKKDDTTNN